jgi:hypothetical protein
VAVIVSPKVGALRISLPLHDRWIASLRAR